MTFRLLFFIFILLPYTVIFLPVQILIILLRLPGWNVLPRGFHRLCARFLGLKITIVGKPYTDKPNLIVSNHISWMDIPAIGASLPMAFVAKSDIAKWPIVGFMAGLQKTIFVNRKRRTDSARTSREMGQRLARGEAVVLFAEGTSDIGTHVLPFRSALVGATQEAMAFSGTEEMVIQPMTIAYTRLDGMPLGRTERSLIAWVGDMGVMDNLFDILNSGTKAVTIAFGEPIVVTPETNRKAVTRLAEIKVREMLVALNRHRPLPPAHGEPVEAAAPPRKAAE